MSKNKKCGCSKEKRGRKRFRHSNFDAVLMCTKGCSTLSCLLYWMAWLNVLLSMGAFATGFVILFSYPFYFGIASPIEIILTPIGLVFILEIDNWMFDVAKYCYQETEIEELWTFTAVCFKDPKTSFIDRISEVGIAIGYIYFFLTVVCLIVTAVKIVFFDAVPNTSELSIWAVILGYSTIVTALIFIYCILQTKCDKYEVVYKDDSLEEGYDEATIDKTKELNIEN